MRKKVCALTLFVLLVISCLINYVNKNINYEELSLLKDNMIISSSDIEQINESKPFGKFLYASLNDDVKVSNLLNLITSLDLKLFNLITIKKIDVNLSDTDLYCGGQIVGLSLSSNGVMVIGSSTVMTENGAVNMLENSDILVGDLIIEIEKEKVIKITDLQNIVNKEENKNKELKVKLIRKDKELETTIKPAKDILTQKYKLGLWIKDDTSGVGTLTYVRKDNKRFGALGHSINDNETKNIFRLSGGDMYDCTVIGLNKGLKGKPGEVKALFVQGKNCIGDIDKNTKYGIFGKYKEDKIEKLENTCDELKAGGRLTAKPGKAKIRVKLDSEKFTDYDIEIIKTNYQNVSSDKSMVIKVTDKNLLEKTGGIIQGMSGSPIIQNGKIIGAITHVFISDPTKGFGVYLDWMIDE